MTYSQLLSKAIKGKKAEKYHHEIQCFLSSLFDLRGLDLYAHMDDEVNKNIKAEFERGLKRILKDEPVAYILGYTSFYGHQLFVDPRVFIPRPETEELMMEVCMIIDEYENKNLVGLDIGTGSGCIAISFAKKFPEAEVFALDISEAALEVARRNAVYNQANVHFFQCDILKNEPFLFDSIIFDCIVSNPPYITTIEKQSMGKNVLDFEPHLALFVPQNNPLFFFERISDFSHLQLRKTGSLYFEINPLYSNAIVETLKKRQFGRVELLKDISGKDRIIISEL